MERALAIGWLSTFRTWWGVARGSVFRGFFSILYRALFSDYTLNLRFVTPLSSYENKTSAGSQKTVRHLIHEPSYKFLVEVGARLREAWSFVRLPDRVSLLK